MRRKTMFQIDIFSVSKWLFLESTRNYCQTIVSHNFLILVKENKKHKINDHRD